MKLPSPRPSVVFREVPEGAILFCTETEVYFSLNPIGVRVWRMLPPSCSNDEEIVSLLSADYPDVNLGTISADVRRLLADLAGNGLVESQRAA